MFIDELTLPLERVEGFYKKLLPLFNKLNIYTVSDLLQHYPRAYENRQQFSSLKKSYEKQTINSVIRVLQCSQHKIRKQTKQTLWRFKIEDTHSGVQAFLLCFNRSYLKEQLFLGKDYFLYGNFYFSPNQGLYSSNFDFEEHNSNPKNFQCILPIYPSSDSLSQLVWRSSIKKALAQFLLSIDNSLPDFFFPPVAKDSPLLSKQRALQSIHFPTNFQNLTHAKRTLVFEEFFLFHWTLSYKRLLRQRHIKKRLIPVLNTNLQKACLKLLSFSLTESQTKVLQEIFSDLNSSYPMYRLLQGDVGSGKTIVAFLSCLVAIEKNEQVVFMAPTELLARQHLKTLSPFLHKLSIKHTFLAGSISQTERKKLLAPIQNGQTLLIIGTHSVFSEDVHYHKLSMIVIDEQHKFGVKQRLSLKQKGDLYNLDTLFMTATPIPRTLAMTVLKEFSVSRLTESPKGRSVTKTYLISADKYSVLLGFIEKELKKGFCVYFIYPLIESSTKVNLQDTSTMFQILKKRFKNFTVELLHSQTEPQEKKRIMENFHQKEGVVLVATTIIEVGIDNPKATIIVVGNSEHFGLSTLHQLRGRVGRGPYQSYVFLMYSSTLGETGKRRLLAMKNLSNGSQIAEEDLSIRGPGQLLGLQQSGFYNFKLASLEHHQNLYLKVAQLVERIEGKYPKLQDPKLERLHKLMETSPPFSIDALDS